MSPPAGDVTGQGVELTSGELQLLGSSLFHLGVHTTREANRALDPGEMQTRHDIDEAPEIKDRLVVVKVQAKDLFKRLEPTAEEHKIEWMDWR